MRNDNELQRILYLEDEPDIRMIAHLALTTFGGFDVLACDSGVQALREGPAFNPQLLLFDVMLPEMDGLETLRRLREIPGMQQVPVVFMTAKVQDKDVAEYRRLGAIGVIAKPFNANTLPEELRRYWHTAEAPAAEPEVPALATMLTQMAANFGSNLPERISALEQLCNHGAGSPEQTQLAIHEAHRLAGSGGTFGYANLSRYMRTLEEMLHQFEGQGGLSSPLFREKFSRLMDEVRSNALQPQKTIMEMLSKSPERHQPQAAENGAQQKLVYVCDDDADICRALDGHFTKSGLKCRIFNELNLLIDALVEKTPDAIVVDIDFPEGRLAGVERLIVEDVPLVFISSHTDIWARLGAVRAGGQAYFAKPLDINKVVDQVSGMLGLYETEPYRVLVIDDMVDTATITANHLTQAGMIVQTVTDPLQSLQAIGRFNPELILMDMYMPEVAGPELASVIRQDSNLTSIPIVFLSGEQSMGRQLKAMHAGADDFLSKSLDAELLVSTVSSKINRYRDLRNLMSLDGLTGLLNHSKMIESLEYELARAKRQGTRLSYGMIDIDRFKTINDTYGHVVGDGVLKNLARLLKGRLRRTDIVGRYGGDELALIMPDTSAQDALRLLEALCSSFNQIVYEELPAQVSFSFSAGIAQSGKHLDSVQELIVAADKALYAAKQQGRNRVICGDID